MTLLKFSERTFFIDLTGKRFGLLSVITRVWNAHGGQPQWYCQCDCGTRLIVRGAALREHNSKSCGCIRYLKLVERNTIHGYAQRPQKHPYYAVWSKMRDRCNNPNSLCYHRYGGRGIKICKRWNSFALFLKDVGERPSLAHTLDRINNDGNYTPKNCRWATQIEQANNTSTVRKFLYRGKMLTLRQIVNLSGTSVTPLTLGNRLSSGWPIDLALSEKLRPRSPVHMALRETAKTAEQRAADAAVTRQMQRVGMG